MAQASSALAMPLATRTAPLDAPARAEAVSAPGEAPGAPAPSVVSLRLQLGLGGSGRSWAGRAGAQIDVWQTGPLGLGLLGAATGHIQADFEAARSFTLLGPVLSLRSEPGDGYFRGALALGLATWSCAPGPCDEEGERGRSVFGAELMVGYTARKGSLGFGWHAGLAALPAPISGDGATFTLTLNLEVGAEL